MYIFSATLCVFVFIYELRAEISPNLLKECKQNPEQSYSVMVELFPIDKSKFSPGFEDFVQFLKRESSESQRPVISAIQNIQGNILAELQSFWIANRLSLKNASCFIINELSKIQGVKLVRKEVVAHFHTVGSAILANEDEVAKIESSTPQWGVSKIQADKVWTDSGKPSGGEGIVVANIDSGVRGSHEALKGNFRKEYGWLDGIKDSSAGSPNDDHGHGTHTMGSICGSNGIGVAPGAKWIACKGCNSQGCSEVGLFTCGQFMACPYTKSKDGVVTSDCSKRPDIVSCSWGTDDSESRDFYVDVIKSWQQVGIFTMFSLGNSGPTCSTTKSPADHINVISVGATTQDDKPANFSSRGPSIVTNEIQPDISAPGSKILSTYKKNDTSYATMSGTSMSAPHVAGLAALIKSKNRELTYDQFLKLISDNAVKPSENMECDSCSSVNSDCSTTGKPAYPNNLLGYGRINAYSTYMAV